MAGRWLSEHLNPGSLTSEPALLTNMLYCLAVQNKDIASNNVQLTLQVDLCCLYPKTQKVHFFLP